MVSKSYYPLELLDTETSAAVFVDGAGHAAAREGTP